MAADEWFGELLVVAVEAIEIVAIEIETEEVTETEIDDATVVTEGETGNASEIEIETEAATADAMVTETEIETADAETILRRHANLQNKTNAKDSFPGLMMPKYVVFGQVINLIFTSTIHFKTLMEWN